MAEELPMLALSPTMEAGVIAAWNKQEGDEVASGDVLCEVETDKATMEYESTKEGTLLKILVGEGEDAGVGDPIAIIGEEGESVDELAEEARQKLQQARAEREEGGGEAKEETKDEAREESEAAEPESAAESAEEQKTAPQREAEEQGEAPTRMRAREGGDEAGPRGSEEEEVRFRREEGGRVRSSPLARKLAREAGLELSAIKGTGLGGRVVKRDVERAREEGPSRPPAEARPAAGKAETVRVSEMRRRIAERMSESKFSAPHYYLRVAADVDALFAARERLNRDREQSISFNAVLLKITAAVLQRHPAVNASWEGKSIKRFGRVDIGLAVALDDGLVAPVVRDCAGKGLEAIDAEVRDRVKAARSGALEPDEYEGATFTVSNLGMYGIDEFTAIVNPPGSAILAVGAARKEAVVGADDELRVARRLRLTLSCDHRVIDGAVGAAFLRELADALEQPLLALR
jgi:pyruvate dehydrogenase E2 component (dihydrolipoamide acetyltransferase)